MKETRKIDSQLPPLEAAYAAQRSAIINRIHDDYTTALRRESLLQSTYQAQANVVIDKTNKGIGLQHPEAAGRFQSATLRFHARPGKACRNRFDYSRQQHRGVRSGQATQKALFAQRNRECRTWVRGRPAGRQLVRTVL